MPPHANRDLPTTAATGATRGPARVPLHVLEGPGVSDGQRLALQQTHRELADMESHMRLLARPSLAAMRAARPAPRRFARSHA